MLVFGMVLIGWSVCVFLLLLLLFFYFLAPVTKLIGVVCTEVSVAPNVELLERQETDFIVHNETNN